MQAPTVFELLIGNLQSIGLIYDVAGILILGIPVMFRSVDRILAQSSEYWDYSAPVAKALSSRTSDTFVGSILLSAGFILQIAAQIGCYATRNTGLFLIGALVLVVGLYWFCLRRVVVNFLTSRAQAKWEKEESEIQARGSTESA